MLLKNNLTTPPLQIISFKVTFWISKSILDSLIQKKKRCTNKMNSGSQLRMAFIVCEKTKEAASGRQAGWVGIIGMK
jgi:hypothetical protein